MDASLMKRNLGWHCCSDSFLPFRLSSAFSSSCLWYQCGILFLVCLDSLIEWPLCDCWGSLSFHHSLEVRCFLYLATWLEGWSTFLLSCPHNPSFGRRSWGGRLSSLISWANWRSCTIFVNSSIFLPYGGPSTTFLTWPTLAFGQALLSTILMTLVS